MDKEKYLALARLGFGILGIAAIITQLVNSIEQQRSIVNFFSFFTIQSNILVALLLIAAGISFFIGVRRHIPIIRGGITLFITMTGVVYILLLSGNEAALQTTIPWVNVVLHYIIPAVFLLDWLFFPPKVNVSFKQALAWLLYPVAYLSYSLIRGAFTGWYPYPFLNPITTGWPTVVAICTIIAISSVVLTWLLVQRTPKAAKNR